MKLVSGCVYVKGGSRRPSWGGGGVAEYGMDWVETIQSNPNPRATDPNPVQSSWWPRIWIQSQSNPDTTE